MTKVLWTPPAEADLDAIAEYIAEDRPGAALRVVRAAREKASSLSEFPNRGRVGRVENTREILVPRSPYIIAYRVTGDVVWVLRRPVRINNSEGAENGGVSAT